MLQLNEKSGKKRSLWLVDPEYKIGSDASCDIQISESSVHSVHARLDVDGDNVTLTDLVGNIDITVNGEKLSVPQKLKHGDTVNLGSYSFDVIDPKQRKKPAAGNASVAASPKNEDYWRLKPLNTALEGQTFIIDKKTVLGRSKECDITLVIAHLSRKHAQLTVGSNGLEVHDLGSANGTFVNKRKVSEHTLKHGDDLSFDTLKFKVLAPAHLVNAPASPVEDLDKTTMRPAINSDLLHAANQTAKQTKRQEAKPTPKRSASELESQSITVSAGAPSKPKEQSNHTVKVIIAVAVVAIGVAAWLVLGK